MHSINTQKNPASCTIPVVMISVGMMLQNILQETLHQATGTHTIPTVSGKMSVLGAENMLAKDNRWRV